MIELLEVLGSLAWIIPMLGLAESGDEDGGGSGSEGTILTSGEEGDKGKGGDENKGDWRDQIPEEIRTNAVFSNVKDIGDLANQFVNAQKLIGAEKILKPKEDWKEEDWDKFFNSIGRPESPDKYSKPEVKLAEGLEMDETAINDALKTFYKAGLTQKQADSVLGFYSNLINNQVEKANKEAEKGRIESENSLKSEFGDKYDEKLDIARSVIKKFGDDDLINLLEGTGLGDSPVVIKLLSRVGDAILEDKAIGKGQGLDVKSETGAKQEIEKLKGDQDFQKALNDRGNPGHNEAVARWQDLHKRAYGTEVVK